MREQLRAAKRSASAEKRPTWDAPVEVLTPEDTPAHFRGKDKHDDLSRARRLDSRQLGRNGRDGQVSQPQSMDKTLPFHLTYGKEPGTAAGNSLDVTLAFPTGIDPVPPTLPSDRGGHPAPPVMRRVRVR